MVVLEHFEEFAHERKTKRTFHSTAFLIAGTFPRPTASRILQRSKIGVVVRKENIRKSEGLTEACEILFEDQAKFEEYFSERDTHPDTKAK